MKILHAAAECFPLAKTGGLGDVVAALPVACRAQGIDARVMLPGYRGVLGKLVDAARIAAPVIRGHQCALWLGRLAHGPVELPVYVLECDALYDREGTPYGDNHGEFGDNAERFGVFSEAAALLAASGEGEFKPDVAHLHDWHTGLAAAWLRQLAPRLPVVFTIHNLGYQGLFDFATFQRTGLPAALWGYEGLEFWGRMSCIKAGIVYADRVTTVSPSHAAEIQTPEFGCGLEATLRFHAGKLGGIINGIDTALWDPAVDSALVRRYGPADAAPGKQANRRALCQEMALDKAGAPLLAYVGRFAGQKGADLLLQALPDLMQLKLNVVVLGAGERRLEEGFLRAVERWPGRCAVRLGHDETLAHRIYAGADMVIMPSRYEPCGLNQMIAQRYGTLPIVRATGGLLDTVTDLDRGSASNPATGIVFNDVDAGAILMSVRRAMGILDNPAQLAVLRASGMAKDFSWLNPVEQYCSLYVELLKQGAK